MFKKSFGLCFTSGILRRWTRLPTPEHPMHLPAFAVLGKLGNPPVGPRRDPRRTVAAWILRRDHLLLEHSQIRR